MQEYIPDYAAELGLAVLLGAIVGIEREAAGQWAGLRTHMLVAMGTALFVLAGHGLGNPDVSSRIIQGVAAGVGFIGAGAILKRKDEHEVLGLTTAASIWVAAAMGTACALREYGLAISASVITVAILLIRRLLDRWYPPQKK
jgi:putative Mg2+ transporter-C (MgtC) family protein